MSELRVGTPDGSSFAAGNAVAANSPSIQLQGFPNRTSSYGYSVASLHSEPDMDTIMPLPGAIPQAQLQNVVSPRDSADGYGSRSSDSEEGEEEIPRRPLLERASTSDFATIEVCGGSLVPRPCVEGLGTRLVWGYCLIHRPLVSETGMAFSMKSSYDRL